MHSLHMHTEALLCVTTVCVQREPAALRISSLTVITVIYNWFWVLLCGRCCAGPKQPGQDELVLREKVDTKR